MKFNLITITPDRARELLARNSGNRGLRRSHVNFLVSELQRGAWRVTNDAIALRTDGSLINGQHRLTAIVEAGIAAQVLYVEGLEEDSFDVLDTGIKRSPADAARISNALAADAMMIAKLFGRNVGSRVPTNVITDIVAWWEPAHAALGNKNSNDSKGLANAPTRIGVGMNWFTQKTAAAKSDVLVQYRALLASDTAVMSRAVATLWKRLNQAGGRTDNTWRMDMMLNAWRCFDPKRAAIAPIVSHRAEVLKEVIAALLTMEQASLDAANAQVMAKISLPDESTRSHLRVMAKAAKRFPPTPEQPDWISF